MATTHERARANPLKIQHQQYITTKKMAHGSVDDVWAEMQRDANVGSADVARLLRKSMATATITTTKQSSSSRHRIRSAQPKETVRSNTRLSTPHEPFSLPRELNRLADERPSVRKQAAIVLETQLLHAESQHEEPSALLQEMPFSDMAKPLFKRFNDPVEKVRDVCIRLTIQLLPRESDLLRVLPYLMPAIANRLDSQWGYDEEQQVFTRDQFLHEAFKRGRVFVNQHEVARVQPNEPSEEIRLQFLELLATLLDTAFARNAASLLHAYVFDILLLLVSGLHDDFHDINIRACGMLRTLCSHMVSVMKHFTVGFVRAAKHLLIHRLARVRVAAVHCVQALVACPNFEKCKGSGTEAIVDLLGHRDENVIPIAAFYTGEVRFNFFAKLDQDPNPVVRSAFYELIEDWILNLPDRYDHESRLMPYLLSAVSDELDETSRLAMETLAELGKRYEQEHGEEVLEMKQYGVDGKNPNYNYTKRLPAPFLNKRPSLGTRLYVRGRTRRFLNPILRELANWQSPTRAHAVRLLKCVLVYSEETITGSAHTLLQTLLKTWNTEGRENVMHFQEIADLIGRFVEPKTYLPLLLARIRGEDDLVGSTVAAEQLTSALEVLHFVLNGSLDRAVLPHIPEIVETLTSDHVLAFETPRLKLALATLVFTLTALLHRRGRDTVSAYFLEHGRLTSLERVFDQLFEVAVALSTATTHPAVLELATSTLTTLSHIQTNGSMAALYDMHFHASFARAASRLVSCSVIQWKPLMMDQLVIDQLVLHVTPAYLVQSPDCVTQLSAHFNEILGKASEDDQGELEDTAKAVSAKSTLERHYQQLLVVLKERLGTAINDASEEAWETLFSMANIQQDDIASIGGNATAA